jgi:hypothetical protein
MWRKNALQHIVTKFVSTLEIATFWIWRHPQKQVVRCEHNEKGTKLYRNWDMESCKWQQNAGI